MYGITLILILAVVGGVIAFIGDRLGTRIGKRKLSIFGLRPRHTAVVVTIFTGVCITTVTFGVMAAVSDRGYACGAGFYFGRAGACTERSGEGKQRAGKIRRGDCAA